MTIRPYLVCTGLLFGVPTAVQAQACPESPGTVSISGSLRDTGSRVPLPGANVVVVWGPGEGSRLSAVSDGLGQFLLCGVPANIELELAATMGPFAGQAVSVRTTDSDVGNVTVEVDLSAPADAGGIVARQVEGRGAGRVVGRVLDAEHERPVSNALVTIPAAGVQGLTDNRGSFALARLPAGEYTIQIEGLGYKTLSTAITVPQSSTVQVEAMFVPDPIELEPILTTIVRYRVPEARGFYDRMDWSERTGLGTFLTREDIARMNPQRVSHLLAQLPGIRLECSGGINSCFADIRGTPASCTGPNVYLDGARVIRDNQRQATPIDGLVLPIEVVGVEVYTNPSEMPGEFSGADAQCGAILFWTSSKPDG